MASRSAALSARSWEWSAFSSDIHRPLAWRKMAMPASVASRAARVSTRAPVAVRSCPRPGGQSSGSRSSSSSSSGSSALRARPRAASPVRRGRAPRWSTGGWPRRWLGGSARLREPAKLLQLLSREHIPGRHPRTVRAASSGPQPVTGQDQRNRCFCAGSYGDPPLGRRAPTRHRRQNS